MSKCLGVIWNCDHVLKQNSKSKHFKKFIFVQKWLPQNISHIGSIVNMINKKLQNVIWKFLFMKKNVFWEKDFERTIGCNPK
jgi:hypothetical protein